MRNKVFPFLMLAAAAVGFVVGSHAAGVPPLKPIIFSGLLEDAGFPITTDTTVRVRLYAVPQGGSALCETSDVVTPDATGRFSLQLADTCTDAVAANPETYTEVQVGSEILLPRQQNGAVPYALEAKRASEASGGLADTITQLERSTRPEQIFSADINFDGTITRQHPQWLQSATLNSTGDGSASFSIQLDNPVCWAAPRGGGAHANVVTSSTTSVTIKTTAFNGAGATSNFTLVCHAAPL